MRAGVPPNTPAPWAGPSFHYGPRDENHHGEGNDNHAPKAARLKSHKLVFLTNRVGAGAGFEFPLFHEGIRT
jgi:hypothetical protein